MSRTYRCRHLPKLPGHARNWVDGNAGSLNRRIEDRLWASLFHGRGSFVVRCNAVRCAMGDVVIPVANRGLHPYLPMEVYFSKKPFRVAGNRWLRRGIKVELEKWAVFGDDYEGYLPGKRDGWDWWEIV